MADNKSFDIMANIDLVEVKNAVEQANKEIEKRYDFKGSISKIELNQKDNQLTLLTEDDYKLGAIKEILNAKLIARKIPVKGFDYQAAESASGGNIRVVVKIQQGIPQDKAKIIVKFIKDMNFKKIQPSINQDIIRVNAPKIDDLQEVMTSLKTQDFGIFIDFGNFR